MVVALLPREGSASATVKGAATAREVAEKEREPVCGDRVWVREKEMQRQSFEERDAEAAEAPVIVPIASSAMAVRERGKNPEKRDRRR